MYSIDRNLNLNDIQYSGLNDNHGIYIHFPLKHGEIVKKYIPHYNKIYPEVTHKHTQDMFEHAIKRALEGDPRKKEIKELKRRVDILECHVNALLEASTLTDN